MIRLSACVEMVFNDLPFLDRIHKTAEMGIPAIEFWSWSGKDLDAIEETARKLNLKVAAMSVSTDDAALRAESSARGGLVGGKAADLFVQMVTETVPVAKRFGSPALIVTSGNELPGVSREAQRESLTAALKAAAPVLEREGLTLVLEPLNTLVNHKGIFLARSDEAFAILDDVNSPNVKLLYDIYHQQITEGNLIDTIRANIGKIGHFHTADVPGRHEPGTGEIDYPNVLAAIEATEYAGYVGMEFRLSEAPEKALQLMLSCVK